jgi:predicted TIM-barrel fold metal-dependent hydrolase
MARNGFKVMDSDMHVIEPTDLWQNYIDPKFRDRAPLGIDRFLGDVQVQVEGVLQPFESEHMSAGMVEDLNFHEVYADPFANGWDPASQLRATDAEGLDYAVLYPSRGLFVLAMDSMDPAFGDAVARAYSRWMSDFCSTDPSRMSGAAMLSPFDVETTVLQVREAAESYGFKAAFV